MPNYENKIKNKYFEGERSLYSLKETEVSDCTFGVGESPLKECTDIDVFNCSFSYKYPLWYCKNVNVMSTHFDVLARSGIWYSEKVKLIQCNVNCPKLFRKCKNVNVSSSIFSDGQETFWNCNIVSVNEVTISKGDNSFRNCDNIIVRDSTLEGDYLFYNCKTVILINCTVKGNYTFDSCNNVRVTKCTLYSRDCFWNCDTVICKDTFIDGEYIGWNSNNMKFTNCEIHSHQAFCYSSNLTIKNSKLFDADLAFELCSDLDVELISHLISIKNPLSGTITVPSVEEIVYTPEVEHLNLDPSKVSIIVKNKKVDLK